MLIVRGVCRSFNFEVGFPRDDLLSLPSKSRETPKWIYDGKFHMEQTKTSII